MNSRFCQAKVRNENRKKNPRRCRRFGNHESRLQALAMRHNLEPAVLKDWSKMPSESDTPPTEQEAKDFSLLGKI